MKKLIMVMSVFLLAGCATSGSEELEETAEVETEETNHIPDEVNHDDYWTELEYDDFARYPDDHHGNKTNIVGRVMQVVEGVEDDFTMFLHSQNVSNKTSFFFIETDLLDERILEDDEVRFYAVGSGEYSYETTQGATRTVPLFYIHDYEIYMP